VPRVEAPAPPPPVVKPIKPPPVAAKPQPKREPPPVVQRETPMPPPQPVVVPQRPIEPEPPVTAPPRVEAPPPVAVPPTVVEAPPPPPPAPAPRAQQQPTIGPAVDAAVLREYGAVVSSAVAKKKVYPRLAMMRHWQGTTDLKLQIAADGAMKSLSVARSSGFDVLDEQAMKMVKDALPLPNLPDALRGREFAIDIPVAFKLQE
jgi:periplasmic protein TonB